MDNFVSVHFKAAFRHYITGVIVVCPFMHDYMELPEYKGLSGDRAFESFNHDHYYEHGFVDQGGKFYTRDDAMKATGIEGESAHLFGAGFRADE